MSGLIAVGAWTGSEYVDAEGPLILFEPQTAAFVELQANLGERDDVLLVRCALGAKSGMAELYRSEPSHSSSLLRPKKVEDFWPVSFNGTEKVRVSTLDREMRGQNGFERLVLDVQGYELEVLKGAKRTLHGINWIRCEVSWEDLYEGGVQVEEVDEYLTALGFERTRLEPDADKPQGDAYYER